jgi:Helix-turn-helix domain
VRTMFDSPYNSPGAFEPLLYSDRAARIIQVHPKTLQRYARNGIVHGVRVGKLWRFRASDLFQSGERINPLDDGDKAQ